MELDLIQFKFRLFIGSKKHYKEYKIYPGNWAICIYIKNIGTTVTLNPFCPKSSVTNVKLISIF